MIFTIVLEQFGSINNGTTATAMRLSKKLMSKGHEVRVLTCATYDGLLGEKVYKLNTFKVPFFNNLILKQGMCFSRVDKDIIRQAVKGADLVHIYLGFNLGRAVKKICQEEKVKFTSAFHCQPENISYSIHLGKIGFVNSIIYKYFRTFFEKGDTVHCPSEMIKNQLIKHKYECNFRVISNGVSEFYVPEKLEKPLEFKNKIVLVSAGRYSCEKRQDLIINAVSKSKYHDSIILILCGQGPRTKALRKQADKLDNPVIFKFCSQEELKTIFNYADFYIHASDAEIEGLACMEAMACGLVPLISNSPLSATWSYALDDKCVFKHGSSRDLANKLDYFIEHPKEIKPMKAKYIEEMKQYRLDDKVDEMINMFMDKINEEK